MRGLSPASRANQLAELQQGGQIETLAKTWTLLRKSSKINVFSNKVEFKMNKKKLKKGKQVMNRKSKMKFL